MNRKEYLLICLMEELSEVQKELSKCLRFTLNHKPDIYNTTNLERVCLEMADVYAIAQLLDEENVDVAICVPDKMSPDMLAQYFSKRDKTLKLMKHSEELGVLNVENRSN